MWCGLQNLCQDCDASYVGQTKRRLITRLKEHHTDINKKSKTPLVLTSYKIQFNHEFNWFETEILDREHTYYKRLTSKMLHIKR